MAGSKVTAATSSSELKVAMHIFDSPDTKTPEVFTMRPSTSTVKVSPILSSMSDGNSITFLPFISTKYTAKTLSPIAFVYMYFLDISLPRSEGAVYSEPKV